MCTDEKKVLERRNREPLGGEKAFERLSGAAVRTSISPLLRECGYACSVLEFKNAAGRLFNPRHIYKTHRQNFIYCTFLPLCKNVGEQGAAKSINRSNNRSPLHCSSCLPVPISFPYYFCPPLFCLSVLFVAADRPVRKIVADCVNPVAFEKVVGEFYDQTRQNQQ